MTHKPVLLIDFDGTLVNTDGKWKPPEQLAAPLPNARAAMWILSRRYKLVCFTSRYAQHLEYVVMHLKKHAFPPMKVTNVKDPNAYVILDDRAITFNGVWTQDLINQIDTFHPWWEAGIQQSDPASHQLTSAETPGTSESIHSPQSSPPPE